MSLKVESFKPLFPNAIEDADAAQAPSYIPGVLFIKEALNRAADIVNQAYATAELLKKDLWGFGGWFWEQILDQCHTIESLYAAIQERHSEIQRILETYRPRIEAEKQADSFYADLSSLSDGVNPNGGFRFDANRLQIIENGISGSYFLLDASGKARFVVKPLDEDAGCLNNRKGLATPFTISPVRDAMPLYRSSLRESLTYQIASAIGVAGITPKTALAILESSQFYDLSEQVEQAELSRYFVELGLPEKEKLCSVQEYVAESKTLFEALQALQSSGLSDEEIANRFDQRDIEDANILIWTTYDNDAHGSNILVYPKDTDELGNERLGLKKIDNGLTFPDENLFLRNALANLPNAKRPLSEAGKAKIAAIDSDALAALAEANGLSSAVPALRQRISMLKKLARIPGITLQTINRQMAKIGRKL